MNLGASAIVIRPRTTAEVFDLACRLVCTAARGLYLRLFAIVFLPPFAALLWLHYAEGWEWLSIWIAAGAVAVIAQGVFTVAAGRLLFSESLGAGAVLRAFGSRFFSYSTTLLVSRAALAASTFLFPLVLWVWTRFFFVHEASLLEGAAAIKAMERSHRFIRGRGVRVFGALVALVGAQACIVVCTELLSNGILSGVLQLGTPFGSLFKDGGSPAALLGLFLSIPYASTVRFLQYIDMRTRSDGWDIQLRFMAIAARDAAEAKAL